MATIRQSISVPGRHRPYQVDQSNNQDHDRVAGPDVTGRDPNDADRDQDQPQHRCYGGRVERPGETRQDDHDVGLYSSTGAVVLSQAA